MKYVIEKFKDKKGLWRFRVCGRNGQIVMTSEAYSSLSNCKRAVNRIHAAFNKSTVKVV